MITIIMMMRKDTVLLRGEKASFTAQVVSPVHQFSCASVTAQVVSLPKPMQTAPLVTLCVLSSNRRFDFGILDSKARYDSTLESPIPKSNPIRLWNQRFQSRIRFDRRRTALAGGGPRTSGARLSLNSRRCAAVGTPLSPLKNGHRRTTAKGARQMKTARRLQCKQGG